MMGIVTLDTAIGKRYIMDRFSIGDVNRVKECRYVAGGRGIDVSGVARLAGENVMATGFMGGHASGYIMQETQRQRVTPFFVYTEGESRSCINLFDCETRQQTELPESGEFVANREQKQLLDHVGTMASQYGVITVPESAPKGASPKSYSDIIEIAKKRGKKVLLDTSGETLRQSLKSGPYLIRPDGDEIKSLTGISPETEEQVVHEAKKLRRMKVKIVMVSLGMNGSVVACNEGVYRVEVSVVGSVNTVGCSDSTMVGLAVGIARGYGVEYLMRYASAVSVANALQEQTGFIDMSDVGHLIPEVDIELFGT